MSSAHLNSVQRDCSGYAFAAGTVRGVRTWKVDKLGRLTGVSYQQVWMPGENQAKCRVSPLSSIARSIYVTLSAAPGDVMEPTKPCEGDDPNCPCGFYAYHDGVSDYPDGDIHGVIEGYGNTTIGTRGFRCSKARILALCIPAGSKPGRVERRYRALTFLWLASILAVSVAVAVDGMPWWLASALLLLDSLMLGFSAHEWVTQRAKRLDGPATAWADKVRRNYPDVAVFDSPKDMLAAFPPDRGLEPTPETDPQFWAREVDR